MHSPGAEVSKCVHPTAKLCTPGAGCTLNFEHCLVLNSYPDPAKTLYPPLKLQEGCT